jgi:6-phosphogluconolactonase
MTEVAVAADVARAAVELFVEATAGAAAARGRAGVALSGGSTAAPLYALLRHAAKVPWRDVQIFFGDERAVPPSDPSSNFGIAERELLGHVPVRQIHRLQGEAPDLDAEAARAARELRQTLGTPPRLDLMLLGLGADGHVLSLFPGLPESGQRGDEELVRHVAPPQHVEPKVARLTMTPFMLVTARNVVLQTSGATKAAALARALKGPEDLVACPAQWLRHAAGRVVVVCDPEAASGL